MLTMEVNKETNGQELYDFITENMTFNEVICLYFCLRELVDHMAFWHEDK